MENEENLNETMMTPEEEKEFRDKLFAGWVHFKYMKVGKPEKVNKRTGVVTPAVPGEMREAYGTLNQDIIKHSRQEVEQAENKAKREHKVDPDSIVYFDRDAVVYGQTDTDGNPRKGAFRSFKKANFEGYLP